MRTCGRSGGAAGVGLGLAVAVLVSGCAGFPLELRSASTPPSASSAAPVRQPSEAEVQNFEQDVEKGEPGGAVTLLVSDTTERRALDAYRSSPGANTSPKLGLGGMFYAKVFGKSPSADRYYLLAGIGWENGNLAVKGSHLWTRTGGDAWRYVGLQQRERLCIPQAVYEVWDLESNSPWKSGYDPSCPNP